VLVEQPYRVAGRRSPAPANQLDTAWTSVLEQLGEDVLRGLPVICGGRSAGARVACRTAADVGAVAVLCLAFPVHPPGRGDDPTKSRLPEIDAVAVPTLVVQGERDPFGIPPEGPNRTVVLVPGTHSLRSTGAIRAAVSEWLGSGVLRSTVGV
jgi:predicted alpha/beta-hydrolase family hydrolase